MSFAPTTKAELETGINVWMSDNSGNSGGDDYGDYGHINTWDVSGITDMSSLFKNREAFNDDIGNWDVSNVLTMQSMFSGAEKFNQDISEWNTSSVKTMQEMFSKAYDFNKPINTQEVTINGSTYTAWDVSNVGNMAGGHAFKKMFDRAWDFNQDIGDWNVANAGHGDPRDPPLGENGYRNSGMNQMFNGAHAFNQDIRKWTISGFHSNALNGMFTETGKKVGGSDNDGFMKDMSGYEGWDPTPSTSTTETRTPEESFFNQSSGSQSGNICFLGSTKVQTDQGNIRFDQLTTRNTINGQKIKKIVKVINSDDSLIFIHKHAFGRGVPNQNTYISRNHGIYLDDSFIQDKNLEPQVHELIYHIAGKNLVRARNLIERGTIMEVKRGNHETLYNVLLETHGSMIVNNILCETLNPNDALAQKYI